MGPRSLSTLSRASDAFNRLGGLASLRRNDGRPLQAHGEREILASELGVVVLDGTTASSALTYGRMQAA